MNEEQKGIILDTYDDYCDTLPHISNLYADLGLLQKIKVKGGLQSLSIPTGIHTKIKRSIVGAANKKIYIPIEEGLKYIDNPGEEVETELIGQDIPGSLENYVFALPIYEHYFELNDEDTIEELDTSLEEYLDKGLIKLALRVRKIKVSNGIYKVAEEVVPVYTSVYNEMLNKLIRDFFDKYHQNPNPETLSLLKSKAMALVCDRKYTSGLIEQVDSMHNIYTTKLDSILKNPDSSLVVNWNRFKKEIERYYNLSWEDIYYNGKGEKVSIWSKSAVGLFDNRTFEKKM